MTTKEIREEGTLLFSKRGAFSSEQASIIEVYRLDNITYFIRTLVDNNDDEVCMYINSALVGQWSQQFDENDNSFGRLTIPSDNLIRVNVGFDPNPPEGPSYQINQGNGGRNDDYCCECNDKSKCCYALPSGNYGYYCEACPEDHEPCTGACIAMMTSVVNNPKGSQIVYCDELLELDKIQIIDE